MKLLGIGKPGQILAFSPFNISQSDSLNGYIEEYVNKAHIPKIMPVEYSNVVKI